MSDIVLYTVPVNCNNKYEKEENTLFLIMLNDDSNKNAHVR